MKSHEQGEAHERISRILEIVKGEKTPSNAAKQKGKKQKDKNRKVAANSESRNVGGDRERTGDAKPEEPEEPERSPKSKVWIKKPDPPTALNAAAPAFTPSVPSFTFVPLGGHSGHANLPDYGCGAMGYDAYEAWPSAPWEMEIPEMQMGPPLPEVVPGTREGEYLGLQCIAEMGEWIVFRERKDNAKPFFWNMSTEEKSWEAPAILQELGVAEVLQKWSEDLDSFGIEPSPALRNPRVRPRRGDRGDRNLREARESRELKGHDAPPGFA